MMQKIKIGLFNSNIILFGCCLAMIFLYIFTYEVCRNKSRQTIYVGKELQCAFVSKRKAVAKLNAETMALPKLAAIYSGAQKQLAKKVNIVHLLTFEKP